MAGEGRWGYWPAAVLELVVETSSTSPRGWSCSRGVATAGPSEPRGGGGRAVEGARRRRPGRRGAQVRSEAHDGSCRLAGDACGGCRGGVRWLLGRRTAAGREARGDGLEAWRMDRSEWIGNGGGDRAKGRDKEWVRVAHVDPDVDRPGDVQRFP